MSTNPLISELLKQHRCDGLIITHPPHVVWAIGFKSSNAMLYLDANQTIIVTDRRYAEAAGKLAATVVLAHQENLATALKSKVSKAKKIGYQPEYLSVEELQQLEEALPIAELVPLVGVLKEVIAVKKQAEIAAMARAQSITDKVFAEILDLLKPGVTEKQIASELVCRQLQNGADGISPEFWPIVSFGANSSMPHADTTETKLAENDVILLDFGCTVGGYCSDMTRTLAIGSPPKEFESIYNLVLQAQEAALEATTAGIKADALDASARNVVKEAGYDIPHGLGHALGLELHEWPYINPRNPNPIPEKAVITIEPGVYLPGVFGVRIEDMVVVEKDGIRNLTTAPKDLIKL